MPSQLPSGARPCPERRRVDAHPFHAIALACAVALAGLVCAPKALAQAAGSAALAVQREVSLSGRPLGQALNALAREWNVAISVDATLVSGRMAPAMQGTLTLNQALEHALAGSGLVAVPSGPAITVQRRGDQAQTLSTVVVTANAESTSDLPAAFAGGQVARGANLGVLGNTDFMDAPFSISSYTAQTIRDQQATSIAEVLTTTDSSVRASIGSGNRYDALTIRGFRVDNDELALNGLYGLVPAYRIGPDPVERIELLKGPGAFLNGMLPWGSVGGGVNIVTKRADDAPLTRFTTEYHSDSSFGGHLDVGRRFGENHEFGIRVNGAARGGETTIDGQRTRNNAGSVGLDYRRSGVRISADIIYQDDWMRAAARGYTPIAGIRVPKAPDPKINLAQSFDYANAQSLTALARGEVDLSRDVTLFAAIGGNRFDYDKQEAPGATILNSLGDASSTSTFQQGRTRATSGEAGVRARIDTGPISHQLVLSGNRLSQDTWFGQRRYGNYATNIYYPIRLISPGLPTSFSPVNKSGESVLQSLAVADTMSVQNGLVQLTLGARRQKVETGYFAAAGVRTDHYDQSATTPSMALVFRPTEHISFYGNYIEALTAGASPPIEAANFNQVFPPYKSKQYEIGSKLDLGSFGATLSLFQISTPSGVVDPITKIFSLDGEQRHRGIELNGFGELTKGVRLLGGVTYLDAKLRRTQNGTNDGNHAIGAPRVQTNVGIEWDTPFVPGLTLSGRAIYTSKAYVSADNLQQVPSWTRLDIGARYATKVAGKPVVWRASLTNLADRKYWEANPTGYLISGMPRTLWLSAAIDF